MEGARARRRGGPPRLAARAAGLLLCGALAGCGAEPAADARPLVAVTVPPQAHFVDRVSGGRVRTAVLIPPGASPATFEPGFETLRALEEAALVVRVGHPHLAFERAWLAPLLAERPDLSVVEAAADVEARPEDPHVWLVPRHAAAMARRIEAGLAEILPEAREALRANREAFEARARALDRSLRRRLAPYRGRRFYVLHPAWGYFAAEYGLEQVAIERERKDPDPHELVETIRRAAAEGVRVLIVSPQLDPRRAELVAEAVGARVATVDPLAYEWEAELGRLARVLEEAFAR